MILNKIVAIFWLLGMVTLLINIIFKVLDNR